MIELLLLHPALLSAAEGLGEGAAKGVTLPRSGKAASGAPSAFAGTARSQPPWQEEQMFGAESQDPHAGGSYKKRRRAAGRNSSGTAKLAMPVAGAALPVFNLLDRPHQRARYRPSPNPREPSKVRWSCVAASWR